MTKPKKTGIYGFYFYIIGIFFFDLPGQSTEIGSPFSGRPIRVNYYFNHDNSPPPFPGIYTLFCNRTARRSR